MNNIVFRIFLSFNVVPVYCWNESETTVTINGTETSVSLSIPVTRQGPANHDRYDMHCAFFRLHEDSVDSKWFSYRYHASENIMYLKAALAT